MEVTPEFREAPLAVGLVVVVVVAVVELGGAELDDVLPVESTLLRNLHSS